MQRIEGDDHAYLPTHEYFDPPPNLETMVGKAVETIVYIEMRKKLEQCPER